MNPWIPPRSSVISYATRLPSSNSCDSILRRKRRPEREKWDVIYVACQKPSGTDEPVHCLQNRIDRCIVCQERLNGIVRKNCVRLNPFRLRTILEITNAEKKERLIYARGIGDHIMFQRCAVIFICNCGAVFVLFCTCIYDTIYMLMVLCIIVYVNRRTHIKDGSIQRS